MLKFYSKKLAGLYRYAHTSVEGYKLPLYRVPICHATEVNTTSKRRRNIMAKNLTRLAVSDFTATEKDLIQGLVRIVIQETMKGFTNE